MDTSVTQLLVKWRTGDAAALANLTALLYRELRTMAHEHVRRERRDHTLQGTALVNEVFMRLMNVQGAHITDRAHFFALASTVMRRVLVDHARARLSAKRGGDAVRISADACDEIAIADSAQAEAIFFDGEAMLMDAQSSEDLSTLDTLLSQLESFDSRQARIVEMRYFGGLTVEQTAQALDISAATVKREWSAARAWLRRELAPVN